MPLPVGLAWAGTAPWGNPRTGPPLRPPGAVIFHARLPLPWWESEIPGQRQDAQHSPESKKVGSSLGSEKVGLGPPWV